MNKTTSLQERCEVLNKENEAIRIELIELEGMIDATDKADVRFNKLINEHWEKECKMLTNEEKLSELQALMCD